MHHKLCWKNPPSTSAWEDITHSSEGLTSVSSNKIEWQLLLLLFDQRVEIGVVDLSPLFILLLPGLLIPLSNLLIYSSSGFFVFVFFFLFSVVK